MATVEAQAPAEAPRFPLTTPIAMVVVSTLAVCKPALDAAAELVPLVIALAGFPTGIVGMAMAPPPSRKNRND